MDLRNKVYAHDDAHFTEPQFNSRTELINAMKSHLEYVRKIGSNDLPEVLTLDYVPYDRKLYRFINGLSSKREKQVIAKKYTSPVGFSHGSGKVKSFNEVQQIKCISPEERNEYGVFIEDGLNAYEGLQNRQDACIRINVLFGLNMWCTLNYIVLGMMEQLQQIGFIDQFGITHIDDMSLERLLEAKTILDKNDTLRNKDE